MKRTQVRALTLAILLTLTLCLLPTMAGALRLEPAKLEFTVGEPSTQSFLCIFEEGREEFGDAINTYGCWINGLKTSLMWNTPTTAGFQIWGTPEEAGEFSGVIEIGVWYANAPGVTVREKLTLHISVRAKETPVAPAAPAERPEIPDYSRCEQALIRGVKEWCNIRQRADINSDIVGRATLGQRISLICWNEDETWCYVDCGGEQGWIAKQFILPIK